MRTQPPELPDELVLARVQENWPLEVAAVEHLSWGFGAWHWAAADEAGRRQWFVTADRLDDPERRAGLEHAYRTARELSAQLPIVAAEVTKYGETCCETEGFAISVTPWVDGARGGHDDLDDVSASETAAFLTRLHGVPAPATTHEWSPRYRSHQLLDELADVLATRWVSGPFADEARDLVIAHVDDVAAWRRRYTELAEQALANRDAWVVTHGEPGAHNQVRTPGGTRWVDWESVRIAPRERDLTDLLAQSTDYWRQAYPHPIDPARVELFDLAWRLDEVGQYTAWFQQPHDGSEDDQIALDGLRDELTRPERRWSG